MVRSQNAISASLDGVGRQLRLLLTLLTIAWAFELVDLILLGHSLDRFGIRPRISDGLVGVALAPLLHGGLGHLIANSIPFLLLGWLVLAQGAARFIAVSLVSILLGGGLVWLLGRPGTVHLGASGLIFGYLGYLLTRGLFERSFGAIGVSLLVGFIYGGAIWGVLPGQRGVSWESHLFGFLSGVVAAWLLARPRRASKQGRAQYS